MNVLAEILYTRIPPAMLERVVFDQNVVPESRRMELFKASGLGAEAIAEKIVDAYGKETPRLAYGLYVQVYRTNWETAELLFEYFKGRPELQYQNHEASLIGHIPTLPVKGLSDFLESVQKQICLVISRNGNGDGVRGTGFLVAPDLVLTCNHVLRHFDPDTDITSNPIELYFDFYFGEPLERVGAAMPNTRKAQLATKWHVLSSSDTSPDGMAGQISDTDIQRISKALDFVLLRLQEPVGLQPLDSGGGRRRGWIRLPDDTIPKGLVPKDWIIIPQHPNGFPQRIDLGRYKERDQTDTRIRYTTNTAPGSSGAPCFNQKFELVGLHNAYVGPEAQPLANQAIRFDCVATLVREYTDKAIKAGTHALRWSVSPSVKEPRVILGRQTLLTWLQKSAAIDAATMADRVYVAHSKVPGAGCSFSIEALHAEIRDRTIPRAVYGDRGQQLPATVDDFLLSLLRELDIDAKQSAPLPARPSAPTAGRPADTGEIDKLEKWVSDELPNWLDRVIANHVEKEVDILPSVQKLVQDYKKNHMEPPEELKAQASAGQPILIRPYAWDCAYVVIDGLRDDSYPVTGTARTELKGEVRSLIAALVKGKNDSTRFSGLRRLRWMFLGHLPDFISVADPEGNGVTYEALDPTAIGLDEIVSVFDRLSLTYLPISSMEPPWPRVVARGAMGRAAEQNPAEPSLLRLQREVNKICVDFLVETGN